MSAKTDVVKGRLKEAAVIQVFRLTKRLPEDHPLIHRMYRAGPSGRF